MAQIILRQANVITSTGGTVKGSPLTNAEVDNNFANLNVATNTLDTGIGTLSSLSTNIKTSVVGAINELRGNLSSSAQLATLLGDETGTGLIVANVSPIISSPTFANSAISVTAANLTSNTMVATTEFVNNQLGYVLVNSPFIVTPNIELPVINNIQLGYTSTETSGSTTTLTRHSKFQQLFTGSSNQTIVLPITNTLAIGQAFHIENNGTGTLTIQSNGGNTVITVPPLMTVVCTCINTGIDTNAAWDYDYHAFGGISGSSGNVVVSVSPSFTGTPQAVTAANNTSNTMIATTEYVLNQISGSSGISTGKSIAMAMIFGF